MSAQPLEPGIDPEATAAVPSGPAEEETRDQPVPQSLLDGPGTCIGPYRLIQKIGEGGMGAVYMAEQEKPVRRKVALEDHQARDGHRPGHRPVRGRAAGPGA